MEEKMRDALNDPKFLYSLAAVLLLVFVVVCVDGYNMITTEEDPIKTHKINIEEVMFMDDEFQGSVLQGYDLQHFRKTGETIKEVKVFLTRDELIRRGALRTPSRELILPESSDGGTP